MSDDKDKLEPQDMDQADRDRGPGEDGQDLDQMDQLKNKCADLNDRLMRMAAETENFKKRSQREQAAQLKRANESMARDLLPVLDNLERALEHAVEDEGPGQALTQGLEMTYRELWKVLERHGLERIEALGNPFDPEFHEAMMQEEDPDQESGTVIRELQRGYLFQGRLLRPSMVVVSKRPAGEDDDEGSGQRIDITVQ